MNQPKKERFKTSVGGQALMEGIMMRGPKQMCCAVRKPDGTIETKLDPTPAHGVWMKIPLVRGAIAMIESMIVGYRYMMYSAQVSMGDDYDPAEEETAFEKWVGEHLGEKAENALLTVAAVLGGLLAILLFTVLPTFLVGGVNRLLPLVRSGAIDAIVVDSVAAMVPRAEIEGEMGDSHVGLQARLMSQAMRKLTSVIGKTNTVCVFINQLREKVGVMYGNPEVTTGGRALKYYASVRIDIRRVEGLKDSSGQFIGNHTRAKIVKNKVAPPFREAEFDIMFGEGISKMSELIDVGVKLGIVQKSGAWFNYGDIRLGQGRDNAKQFLKDNPEIANDIEGQIRANADKLYATRRPAGRAVAAAAEKPADPAAAKEPVVKAPTRSSESELDIMVED